MKDFYNALAPFYDILGEHPDYAAWADFYEECFRRYAPAPVESVLDLGCGTGSMTLELARRGYDMIGVDNAADMLAVARERAEREKISGRVLLLCQDMCEFELYGTVDAVVSTLDCINHVTDRKKLSRLFHWVHNYLNPNGLFLFDLNSPYKFENVYGDRAYLLEEDGVVCAWQNDYRKKSGLCDFYISLFTEEEDGRYAREDIQRRERVYTLAAIRRLLAENGLELLLVAGDFDFSAPREDTQRYYLAARAVKEEL